MKLKVFLQLIFLSIPTLLIVSFSSCNKKEESVAFTGNVVSVDNTQISGAKVEIFRNAEDWLTGLNVLTTMVTDLSGRFESEAIYEAGEYYIFIEKYDSSNWEIRKVEQGIYPQITVPEETDLTHTIEFNNMSAMAETAWKLTNVHREFTKPGATAVEWQSIWSGINNCKRDNQLFFNKDLSMRFSEGATVCRGNATEIIGTFVPPMIFNILGCETLPFTKIPVKQFEYSNWPEMEAKGAKMYLSCNSSVGQTYILYTGDNGLKVLEVYTRSR